MIIRSKDARVRVQKLSEVVAAKIRREIITGVLKSDGNLPSESMMLEEFQVSRPTLREALRILESEGLIEISRGIRNGARIRPPSDNAIAKAVGLALQFRNATVGDVYKARMMLEPVAARMAAGYQPLEARKALKEQLAIIASHAAEATDANRFQSIQHEVTVFHRIVVQWSGNITIQIISTGLTNLTEHHQNLAYRARPIMTVAARRKQVSIWLGSLNKLADLIGDGEAEQAEEHWQRHLRMAGEEWFDKVGQTLVIDVL
jgi:DNA-binding FadR family transcriptional regulator